MPEALDKIRTEHKDIAQVLKCLETSVQDLSGQESQHDFELIWSALYYIRMFADRYHHPKEEQYLFTALRKRTRAFAPVLDELVQQHAEGGTQVADLEDALKQYEQSRPEGLDALVSQADAYIAQQRAHMQREENELLPLAEDALLPEDWVEIDAAFRSNSDPLFGENLETAYHALHNHIMNMAQAARR